MKKLSLFQIVLLASFGAFAIAGVLIFSFAVGGNASKSVGPVQIWGTLDQNAFSAVLRQLAETDPSLSQVTYVQKDPATFDSDITKALASGSGPDLFLLRQDYAFKDRTQIAIISDNTISEAQFTSTFIEAARPFYAPQGTLALPLLADPLVLYWNKDVLASGGFSRPPSRWAEVYEYAQKLTVRDTDGTIETSAVALGEYRNVNNAKDILATLFLQAGAGLTSYDASDRLISTLIPRGGGSGLSGESALRFFADFADPSKDYYSWSRALPSAQQAFATGQLALYVGYASEQQAIARSNPNLNFGVAALPQVNAGNSLTLARVYGLAASRVSKSPQAAVTVAAALAGEANSQALSTVLGLPSARRDVLEKDQSPKLPKTLVSEDDICKGENPVVCMTKISRSWVDPDPTVTDAIFQTMIENTTSGASVVTVSLQRADLSLTQLLSQSQPQAQ